MITESMILACGELRPDRESGKLRGPNHRNLFNPLQRVVGWSLAAGFDPVEMAGKWINTYESLIDDPGDAEGMAAEIARQTREGRINVWHVSGGFMDDDDGLARLFPRSLGQRRLAYTCTQLAQIAHERDGVLALDPGTFALALREAAEWALWFNQDGTPDHKKASRALELFQARGFLRLITRGRPHSNAGPGKASIYELTYEPEPIIEDDDVESW